MDKVNWNILSGEPNAIFILEKNVDKINWRYLSRNLSIFQNDYDTMRENGKIIAEEIAKIVWHPSRMSRWPEDPLIDDIKPYYDLNINYVQITSTIRDIKICIKLIGMDYHTIPITMQFIF